MEADTTEGIYLYTYTFDEAGDYLVTALAESDLFRCGVKESTACIIHVVNGGVVTTGILPAQTAAIGETFEAFDCNDYFASQDSDALMWEVSCEAGSGEEEIVSQGAESENDLSDLPDTEDAADSADSEKEFNAGIDGNGILTIVTGWKKGVFRVTVSVTDGYMETAVTNSFEVTVENRELQLTDQADEGEITLRMAYNGDWMPEFLKKLAGIAGGSAAQLSWGDYFQDPDGIPAVVTIEGITGAENISVDPDDVSLLVSASGAGESEYLVTAVDYSDSSVTYSLALKIVSDKWFKMVAPYVWAGVAAAGVFSACLAVVVAACLAFIVWALFKRKIYGIWEFEVRDDRTKPDEDLGGFQSDCNTRIKAVGNRRSADLGDILKAFGLHADLQNMTLRLKGGNFFTRKVRLAGDLEKMDAVGEGNEIYYDKKSKKRILRKPLKPGRSVTVTKNGISVTIKRLKR